MERKETTVVIVDDHPIFVQGLKIIIGSFPACRVVGESGTIDETMLIAGKTNPDVVIVDLNLGNEDGLVLVKKLKKEYPGIRIIVLSMLDERHYAERAFAAGARAYIMKEETAEVLQNAIDLVMQGKVWVSERQRDRYLEALFSTGGKSDGSSLSRINSLSDRQLGILNLIGKGYKTGQIAGQLSISAKTVEAHKTQLKKKLGNITAQELLKFAIEWVNRRS